VACQCRVTEADCESDGVMLCVAVWLGDPVPVCDEVLETLGETVPLRDPEAVDEIDWLPMADTLGDEDAEGVTDGDWLAVLDEEGVQLGVKDRVSDCVCVRVRVVVWVFVCVRVCDLLGESIWDGDAPVLRDWDAVEEVEAVCDCDVVTLRDTEGVCVCVGDCEGVCDGVAAVVAWQFQCRSESGSRNPCPSLCGSASGRRWGSATQKRFHCPCCSPFALRSECRSP